MTFELYMAADSKLRWRLKAKNGHAIAESGEGYNTQGNARRAIKNFMRSVAAAKIEVSHE